MEDTICAISTAVGVGAISIIRVSGTKAIEISNKIFKGKDLKTVATHTIHYGYIINNKEVIDEVLVSIMKKPKTFTKEDMVEINCHGGISTTKKVLELLLEKGARLSEPGEFTKRAFLNGRIDLVEAEAVMDLINTKTENARKIAINELQGKSSNYIRELRQEILELIANIEVNIDYPEYEDIEEVNHKNISAFIPKMRSKLENIIRSYENSKLIKEGIKVAIVGRPNVGKSSILNRLLDEEKAIVTDIPGTTRDIVEGEIVLDGILLNIIDTAGIRETKNDVEKIGIIKSLKSIDNADLVLVVLNNNEKLTNDDIDIIRKAKSKKHIIVINKSDLNNILEKDRIQDENIITINTKEDTGIDALKEKIKSMFLLEELSTNDYTYLSNSRQISLVKSSLNILNSVEKALENNIPIDLIEIDIRKIWEQLGEIIGENYSDELINQLFSQFCLGK